MSASHSVPDSAALPGLSGPLPPFLQTVGMRNLVVADGQASIELDFDAAVHANGIGVAHGGVLCTLLDVVMGYAAYAWPANPGPIVTVNQNVQFINAMRGPVRVRGWVVNGGKSMVFCSAEVLDQADNSIAIGQGAFKKIALNRGGRFEINGVS
ncbi:PaaI family thioesterase [Lampropedia aestuarii]|uniref:PaaI family thioesterase n=1 Tax=Lampropedia aestuarii TaxID=2562762 RepID=A0A4S5BGB0_9BURK|nr:PaaI family thioesterase [Lampropedia aestuarii]THJ31387.1 PaaI family thioesterase [Lampropedia aestuarii]